MKIYKIGKIVFIGKSYIILESSYIGEYICVARPNEFKINTLKKVYIYEHRTDYADTTYGFPSFKEKMLFENLMKVAGIGPKTALNLLSKGVDKLINIIANEDGESIIKFPSIGAKTAAQIFIELSSVYKDKTVSSINKVNVNEIAPSLKVLGFSKKQIELAISKVKPQAQIEPMIEEAIKVISSAARA